jgi:hypothetical protein
MDLQVVEVETIEAEWVNYLLTPIAYTNFTISNQFFIIAEKICANFHNDIIFFLTNRKSATNYHEMEPGIVTEAETQEEIVNELIYNKVNYVVTWSGAEKIREAQKSF